jgi:CrcB protein
VSPANDSVEVTSAGSPARLAAGSRGIRLERIGEARLRALAVLSGGAVGTLARVAVAEALPHEPAEWPWATFLVNVAGALVLAWLITRLSELVAPTRYLRLLIGTGFCGALTTFSTLQVETIRLAKDGPLGIAVSYAAASIAVGMLVAIGATLVARRRRYG